MVIVFRQLLKATYYGKCVKTEIQHLSIVLTDVIENLHKSCKLVYILLYRTRRDITTEPYFNRQYLKKHIRGLNRMNVVYVVILLTGLQIIYHFIGNGYTKCGTGLIRGGCQLLKGSCTLKCRRNAQ